MSSKLAIALGVLVVLVGITVFQFNAEEAADKKAQEVGIELPKPDREAIDRLEVAAPGKKAVTLVKGEDGWKLIAPAEAKDARAAETALKTVLDKLAGLEVTAVAATRAENHERLEVTEDKAIHVVAKQGEQVLSDLWIGAYVSGNTMVRKQGETPVAAVKGSIRFAFDKEVKEWRDRKILELDTAAVQGITLTNADGALRFVRDGDAFKQAEGETPIEEFDPGKVKSIVGSVTSLRAVDFAKPGVTQEQAGLGEGAATVALDMASDAGASQVLLRIGKREGSNYYLQQEGNEILYLVSSFMGDRLMKGAKGFKKDPPPAEPPPAAAAAPQGLPPGFKLPPGMQMPAGHP